jgi:Cu+-exporting ATPase
MTHPPTHPHPATGHLLHSVGLHSLAHSPILDALSNPLVSGVLGAFALLGPGRQLLLDGFKSLAMGNPNMNSLVAVGSTTSFSVGALSVLVPGLGFGTSFLEEPVMLLAFVLLGRALEARAKVGTAGHVCACMCGCVHACVGGGVGGAGAGGWKRSAAAL